MRSDSSRISSFRLLINANHLAIRLSLSTSIASSVSTSKHTQTVHQFTIRAIQLVQKNVTGYDTDFTVTYGDIGLPQNFKQ